MKKGTKSRFLQFRNSVYIGKLTKPEYEVLMVVIEVQTKSWGIFINTALAVGMTSVSGFQHSTKEENH